MVDTAPASRRTPEATRPLRLGIAGLGVGSALVIPTMERLPIVELVAAADTRPEALAQFAQAYGGRTYDSVERLCADPDVDAIWVATPNQFHCEHVALAASHGKHVVSETPMALSVAEAERMVEAAERHGVYLLCGHTYSLNPSIQAMHRIVHAGGLGRVTGLATWMYSDWLLKPRLPQELDVTLGGGVVYRHLPHIVDSLRTIGGGLVRSVRAMVGAWLPERPAPGNVSAYLEFEDGTPATISYGGYGYFNTADLAWGIGDRFYTEEGAVQARRAVRAGQADDEAAKDRLRTATRQEGDYTVSRRDVAGGGNWFGILLVSCERGILRQSPGGVLVYDDDGHHEVPVAGSGAGGEVELRELHAAVRHGVPLSHDGRWGLATLEVCLAMMESGRERREIMLRHQCPTPARREDPANA